jgi:hypothetical protein
MKSASKNLVRTMLLGSVLAGGISLAQSFYNEAQATGGAGNFVYSDCTYQNRHGQTVSGGQCKNAGGNCGVSSTCG